jgi:GntR family transcriptional repressor for pyruvate dehydrogenase complex
VAREILHDIVDRELPAGAKLPSEVEMVENFDVARASLREALRILDIHGLIRIKPGPGGGPVVADIDAADLGRTQTFFFQAAGVTFREVMQARLILEPIMARQAAERDDPDVRVALEAGIAGSQALVDGDDDGYLSVANGFHEIVASASGNRVLDLLANSLKQVYLARIRAFIYRPAERQKLLADHDVVAEAILSGDGDGAERLMQEHMEEYVRLFEARFPGFMDERIDWF